MVSAKNNQKARDRNSRSFETQNVLTGYAAAVRVARTQEEARKALIDAAERIERIYSEGK